MTKSLQILDEPAVKTISYSSAKDFQDCGHFFKLSRILKVGRRPPTMWTNYGTLAHKWVQAVLEDKCEPDEARKKFIKTWYRFCKLYAKQLKEQHPDIDMPFMLYVGAAYTIAAVKEILQKKFGNFTVVGIEDKLKLPAGDIHPQLFIGYLDIVLKLETGEYVIVDLKFANSLFFFEKYKDKYKDYQLTLYKKYFCKDRSVDVKDVSTYFFVIERAKKKVKLIEVGSTKKKISNATKWLDGILTEINTGKFRKKRSHCYAYNQPCMFAHTEHCPSSIERT